MIKVIVLREKLIESFFSDLVTFGWMIGGCYLNYTYMGQSTFVNVVLVFMFGVWMLGRAGGTKKMTLDEAAAQIEQWRKEPTS